ncbi:hypothetical protein D9M68_404770 [compost metagenome]
MPTSRPESPPSAAAMANTVWFTRFTSTPICCAASRSCAVARTAQPSFVKRRKPNSTAALAMPMPAISRSSAPMVPVPICRRQSGSCVGSARGSGLNTSCTRMSSTKLMPMVASSGAMRAAPCNGRKPTRSMSMPSAPEPNTTSAMVIGSGVCR